MSKRIRKNLFRKKVLELSKTKKSTARNHSQCGSLERIHKTSEKQNRNEKLGNCEKFIYKKSNQSKVNTYSYSEILENVLTFDVEKAYNILLFSPRARRHLHLYKARFIDSQNIENWCSSH